MDKQKCEGGRQGLSQVLHTFKNEPHGVGRVSGLFVRVALRHQFRLEYVRGGISTKISCLHCRSCNCTAARPNTHTCTSTTVSYACDQMAVRDPYNRNYSQTPTAVICCCDGHPAVLVTRNIPSRRRWIPSRDRSLCPRRPC